ncbi:MAG: tRNA (guanosine(46)-N7)-methyltransferase TrmB [Gammaproteobacteria bacterium]|nr:tRNA (guanosine(46)-N7)-methyltransferase TrmB [Gammaproteobacteria bacterium]
MNATETNNPLRRIKSFVKREGRFTPAQSKALLENWSFYGLDCQPVEICPEKVFGRVAPLIIEIGFGMGVSFLETIEKNPEHDFIGIEVHRPGVGAFLHQAQQKQIANVRVYCHDAVEVLRQSIPDNSVDKVCIFFPDPWPKKRHNKRRLIQSEFVELIAKKLKKGGCLHLATDWENYAEHMLAVLQLSSLINTSESGDYVPRPESRVSTKYEQRGERLGHMVRDLMFAKF